jgi:hypothetical protein
MRIALSALAMSLIVSCGASSPPPAASSPTASDVRGVRKTFALIGEDGVVVEIVDFEDGSGLLHVKGLDSTLQDKVYRVKLVKQDGDLIYTLPWRGREWSTVIRSGDPSFLGRYWVLRAPSSDLSVPLAYSDSHTPEVSASALLATHEQQKQSGELDKLQRYDRRAEYKPEEEALADSAKSVDADCGSKLSAAIAWDTVDDKALQERSISSYCGSALNALRAACSTSGGKQFVQQVRQVTCRFDGHGEMSLNAGQLSWAINFELSDLDTLASRALSALPAGTQAAN